MRILLIHRYFWPDSPPYASMLRVIGRHLAAQGHEVTVLSTQPSYTEATKKLKQPAVEALDGMRVLRRPMLPESKRNMLARLLNVLLFQWHIFAHLLRHRRGHYDLVTATTMPPVVVAGTAAFSARLRGARFLYHCMDLYPEIAQLSGKFPLGRGPLPWLLGLWDRRTCRKAWRVVVLSEDMRRTLAARGLSTDNVRLLNNFALEDEGGQDALAIGAEESIAARVPRREGEVRVLFAGNIGRFQGLEAVIEAAGLLRDCPDVQFHFLGDGAARAALEQQAGDLLGETVHFHGFQPLGQALQFMETADLGIVSLQPGVIASAFPSKTMTYLASGLPLLTMVEEGSALESLVREEGVGLSTPQGDAAALAEAIRADLARPEEERQARRTRALALAEREFSTQAAMQRWDQLLAELGGASSAR